MTDSNGVMPSGVAKRVAESIDKLVAGDFESAMIPACIAVDATASKLYPGQSNNQRYKQFIDDNLGLITRVGMGNVSMLNMRIEYDHPDVRPGGDGLCSIAQILYHVVRCGLLHDAQLADTIRFTDDGTISVGKVLALPAGLIRGLLAAVVVAPVNAAEKMPGRRYRFNIGAESAEIGSLWGKKDVLLKLFEHLG